MSVENENSVSPVGTWPLLVVWRVENRDTRDTVLRAYVYFMLLAVVNVHCGCTAEGCRITEHHSVKETQRSREVSRERTWTTVLFWDFSGSVLHRKFT